jgi:hypothetical protein
MLRSVLRDEASRPIENEILRLRYATQKLGGGSRAGCQPAAGRLPAQRATTTFLIAQDDISSASV